MDIQKFDLEKAFDSLWLDECCNDVFDNIEEEQRNDKIALLSDMNKKYLTSIKTSHGMTKRVNFEDIVQQGGIWGPVFCSNSEDSIGRTCNERKVSFYKYRNVVNILPLTFVDDVEGTAKCGTSTLDLNLFITTQMESKRLKFNEGNEKKKGKCFRMHVRKNKEKIVPLKAHNK